MSTSIRSDQPLGSVNYQHDQGPRSLSLVDVHEPFLTALQNEPRLISGRKGSGKSTVLYALRHYDELRPRIRLVRPEGSARQEHERSNRHVIAVSTHREFEPIVESVYRLAYERKGTLDVDRTTETLRDEWEDRLWYQVISYFYSLHIADPHRRSEETFRHVIAYFDRNFRRRYIQQKYSDELDVIESKTIVDDIAQNARIEIINHLSKEKNKCYILIDSLEEYPIHNEKWLAVVRGFLPAIEAIQAKYSPQLNIVATIPEEIEYIFREQPGSEPGKNFSSVHRIRWKAKDLKRIVAHRFLELFKEIVNEDSLLHTYYVRYDTRIFQDILKRFEKIDLVSHRSVDALLSEILPETVRNRMEVSEEVWPYIIRHTHICPRHVLLILNEAIKAAGDYWRQYGKLNEEAVREGISTAEKVICPNICVPYQSIYPEILDLIKIFCDQLPSFFDFKQLSKMSNVIGRQLRDPISDRPIGRDGACRLLFDMGVIGRIEKRGKPSVMKYEETRYFYTKEGVPELSDRFEYCLHPAFSGLYEARDRNRTDPRLSYPAGVEL